MNDRQRLEAIVAVVCRYLPPDGISREDAMREIIGLVDPLPEQFNQEPVAWMVRDQVDGCRYPSALKNPAGSINGESQPLYTAPPRTEWDGLTVEEIRLMAHNDDKGDWNDLRFRSCWHNGYVDGVNAANAKLKELNK